MQNKAGIGLSLPFLEEKLMNVPLSAVFGDSENRKTYVWVVEGNKVSRREVTVLFSNGRGKPAYL